MEISEQGLALIRRFEGFSHVPYLCPAGKSTIGYGHVLGAGDAFPPEGIGLEEGEKLLKTDAGWAAQAVTRLAGDGLSQCQFDALCSLVFNIGDKAFEKSTLLRLLQIGNMAGAQKQFSRWIYVSGQKSAGLIARRSAETLMFGKTERYTPEV